MNEGLVSIITALITGLCAVAGQYLISDKKTREEDIKNAHRDQKIDDRLGTIEKKLDEHNHYAKRFEDIEKAIVKIETKINS